MCLNAEAVQTLKKPLAKSVLSPCVYFLDDGCLGNALKMRQSISHVCVNILCGFSGKSCENGYKLKSEFDHFAWFSSLVKPKSE